jgi:hypothetical protein
MIKYLQLPFYFDVSRLQEEVFFPATNSWQLHYQKLHYEGEWSAIPLRSVNGKSDSIIISPFENDVYKDTSFLQDCPYLQSVLKTFKCPLQAVRLLKLNAGAIIKEHRDAELNFEKGAIRLHIPVITHDEVEFYLENERIHLKEGECWYMNFNLLHSINNKSNINRIHLVIDALVNDWVKEIFSDPSIMVKKEAEDMEGKYSDATKRQMIIMLREMNTAVSNQLADDMEKETGEKN